VLNGPFLPTLTIKDTQEPRTKAFSQWTIKETRMAQYNVRDRNIISYGLTLDEFYGISMCRKCGRF